MTHSPHPALHAVPGAAQSAGERGRPRRVYALNLLRSRQPPDAGLLPWITGLGFDTLLLCLPRHVGSAAIGELPPIARDAAAAGLEVRLDLAFAVAPEGAAVCERHPDWYRAIPRRFADPREAPLPKALRALDLPPEAADAFLAYWSGMLRSWADSGIGGYRCTDPGVLPPGLWRALTAASPGGGFAAWTPGMAAADVAALPRDTFDTVYNSLAWWDFGAAWLRQEQTRLALVAPVANTLALTGGAAAARRLLEVAGNNGHGLIMPIGFEFGLWADPAHPAPGAEDWRHLRESAGFDLAEAVRDANARLAARGVPPRAAPALLSGEEAGVAVLHEAPSQLTLANRHLDRHAAFDPAAILPMLDGGLTGLTDAQGRPLGSAPFSLAPGEVRVLTGAPGHRVVTATDLPKRKRDPALARLAAAAEAPRIAIEAIAPSVEAGRFAVKRVVGERVAVTADIFTHGHGKIAAALQWRACDEVGWREVPMRPLGNDRWIGEFLLERVGAHLFRILAWPDRFASFRDELVKKHAAGLDVALEVEEGRLLLAEMAGAAPGTLDGLLAEIAAAVADERIALLTGDRAAALAARADDRPAQAASPAMPVEADRRAAEFAAWYELFPRSQSGDPARHGTFADVARRLPGIRDMGFDVLYVPPIHPIGRSNRKGRNNSLTAAPDDPGSPYAIGAAEGGHDAIHPALGTIEDFRSLRDAATAHGLEIALDFAIQCSPDHPWLGEHPEWFDWRPDGGLRYAENPPKKYEDIVNVDFHRPGAVPGLWLALRDIVAFWVGEGVRIFRVDNPHTKPFAFWEWLIAEIRARHPDTLFLSEAFTRPRVMERLAKLGFSQSYTYFTWRNEKQEIEAYLRELTATAPLGGNLADFFRPNFFVNTPDINPVFLQHSGRPGFLIRAALAATLSGLWGMLQGFEFCEAAAIPGKEEYADSDKYQIRARPDRMAGDIVDEIARLNAIRRDNPALQSHRGVAFHNAANDRVLWYRKANIDRSNVVLVAVSLDLFAPQEAEVEVPLWEWGLGDDAALLVDDLLHGGTAAWHGKHRRIRLDPALPYGIWRARPMEAAR